MLKGRNPGKNGDRRTNEESIPPAKLLLGAIKSNLSTKPYQYKLQQRNCQVLFKNQDEQDQQMCELTRAYPRMTLIMIRKCQSLGKKLPLAFIMRNISMLCY